MHTLVLENGVSPWSWNSFLLHSLDSFNFCYLSQPILTWLTTPSRHHLWRHWTLTCRKPMLTSPANVTAPCISAWSANQMHLVIIPLPSLWWSISAFLGPYGSIPMSAGSSYRRQIRCLLSHPTGWKAKSKRKPPWAHTEKDTTSWSWDPILDSTLSSEVCPPGNIRTWTSQWWVIRQRPQDSSLRENILSQWFDSLKQLKGEMLRSAPSPAQLKPFCSMPASYFILPVYCIL